MSSLAFFIGGLIPTLLVSRLTLWILKRWDSGYVRIVSAHILSLILSAALYQFGTDSDFSVGLVGYALPQLVWLTLDVVRKAWRKPEVTEPAKLS